MKYPVRNLLSAAALCFVFVGGAAWPFGFYPAYFDIEWDEEVLMHDGALVMVHVRRTFARLSRFNRWGGVHRDTEISFDAGGKLGRFNKKFEGYEVSLLERKSDRWFVGLLQTTGTPPIKWVDFNTPILVLGPDGQLRKEHLANFPVEFERYNVMPVTPDANGIAKFDGKILRNTVKMQHWGHYPRGAGDDTYIRRRNTSSDQGEKK